MVYTQNNSHILFDIVFILVLISYNMIERVRIYLGESSGTEMGWDDTDGEKIS